MCGLPAAWLTFTSADITPQAFCLLLPFWGNLVFWPADRPVGHHGLVCVFLGGSFRLGRVIHLLPCFSPSSSKHRAHKYRLKP